MKKIILLTAATALLVGCGKKDKDNAADAADKAKAEVTETVEKVVDTGPSDRDVLMKSCLDEGSAKEVCTCSIDAMEDTLSPETLAYMVEAAKIEDPAAAEAKMMEMSEQQMMEFMGVMPKLMECDPGLLENMGE